MNKRLLSAAMALVLALPLARPAPAMDGIAVRPASGANETAAPAITEKDDALSRVMWVVLVVWLGLGAYLFKIDRRIARLERKIDER